MTSKFKDQVLAPLIADCDADFAEAVHKGGTRVQSEVSLLHVLFAGDADGRTRQQSQCLADARRIERLAGVEYAFPGGVRARSALDAGGRPRNRPAMGLAQPQRRPARYPNPAHERTPTRGTGSAAGQYQVARAGRGPGLQITVAPITPAPASFGRHVGRRRRLHARKRMVIEARWRQVAGAGHGQHQQHGSGDQALNNGLRLEGH